MGEIILRNWNFRDFCVRVNLVCLIRQVLLPIWRLKTLIRGLLNPIRTVVPLTSHIRLYPPYRSYLYPPSLFLYRRRRTQMQVIPLYRRMPWSKVKTVYSIHRVQHTLSTAHTEYCIHRVRHHSKIDCLLLIASLSSHGGHSCTQLSTFPWLWVNQWIESQLPSHLPSDLLPPDWPPTSTPPILMDLGLQVHLQSCLITASKCISDFNLILAFKCISKLAPSRPPSASASLLYHSLKVHLSVTQSPNASPNSLDHGLDVHVWVELDLGV